MSDLDLDLDDAPPPAPVVPTRGRPPKYPGAISCQWNGCGKPLTEKNRGGLCYYHAKCASKANQQKEERSLSVLSSSSQVGPSVAQRPEGCLSSRDAARLDQEQLFELLVDQIKMPIEVYDSIVSNPMKKEKCKNALRCWRTGHHEGVSYYVKLLTDEKAFRESQATIESSKIGVRKLARQKALIDEAADEDSTAIASEAAEALRKLKIRKLNPQQVAATRAQAVSQFLKLHPELSETHAWAYDRDSQSCREISPLSLDDAEAKFRESGEILPEFWLLKSGALIGDSEMRKLRRCANKRCRRDGFKYGGGALMNDMLLFPDEHLERQLVTRAAAKFKEMHAEFVKKHDATPWELEEINNSGTECDSLRKNSAGVTCWRRMVHTSKIPVKPCYERIYCEDSDIAFDLVPLRPPCLVATLYPLGFSYDYEYHPAA